MAAFFTLKSAALSYAGFMRFALIVMAVWILGISPVSAQWQLLPPVSPPKPTAKLPKPEREAATHGNFPRRMKREEIEALFFTGQPVEASGLGRASFQVTFFKDGTAERLNHVNNERKKGKWQFLGDGYCSKWEGSGEGCYTVVKDGDIYKIVRGTRAISFWSAPGTAKPPEVTPATAKVSPLAKTLAVEAPQKASRKGDLLSSPDESSDKEQQGEQQESNRP